MSVDVPPTFTRIPNWLSCGGTEQVSRAAATQVSLKPRVWRKMDSPKWPLRGDEGVASRTGGGVVVVVVEAATQATTTARTGMTPLETIIIICAEYPLRHFLRKRNI